jgi:GNAT superfamily N-acetyltransferase
VIRTASPDDLPALRALFARANESPYDLAAVAEEKCFGHGVSGSPVVRVIERDARIVAASVTCGRWLRILAVDRDARRAGLGSALLADAELRGVSGIAGEAGNYFTPGIFEEDEGARAFLRARGYVEKDAMWNLAVILSSANGEGSHGTSAGGPSRSAALRMTAARRPNHHDADRILTFIEREFGRIWRFEASKAFDADVPKIFVAEEQDEITGFAVHDVNNRGLGFFGPTGVMKSMRGRGIGCQLLLASLADMRRLGFARVVIPWTDALEFYRKCCGAEPAHRFIAFGKREP